MASNSYPMMNAANWWKIRKKFNQTLPGVVTPSYLASVLNMQEISATNNIMPYLRQTGIIDADGKTTERARLWRDDIDYPKVCDIIRREIYPQELLDIPITSKEDIDGVKRWFFRTTGSGESSVSKMVAFYLLLVEKDPLKTIGDKNQSRIEKPKSKPNITSSSKFQSEPITKESNPQKVSVVAPVLTEAPTQTSSLSLPTININLQIHISADASAEQIDKIFESMYKYIYNKKADLNG